MSQSIPSDQPQVEQSHASQSSSIHHQITNTNTRLDHLIQSGAFNDCTFSRGMRHGVKRILSRWTTSQEGLQVFNSRVGYNDLKLARKSKTLPNYDPANISQFTYVPSPANHSHHCIKDHNGNILAYRFPYPDTYLDTLIASLSILPHPTSLLLNNTRGTFQSRLYALWADYSPTIFQSSDYRRDHPYSQQFLDTNKPLFQYLSNNLRVLDPEMYCKFTGIDSYLPHGLSRMAGAWHGVAINQNMLPGGKQSTTHQDWQDYYRGYNCVLPWGDYTGADLVLYQCRVVYQLRPGDALFFLGSLIAHQVTEITSGSRHVLDLFTHKSAFDWKKREAIAHGKTIKYGK
jgi:hypothetical protein